jgi:predicted O-methyltransferase YrrM
MKKILSFITKYTYALGGILYLLTIGMLQGKHRGFLVEINKHFGLHTNPIHFLVPEISPEELFKQNASIDLRELTVADGNVSALELIIISKLIKEKGPQNIFEIGTFAGRTTFTMALNSTEETKIFTLDLPENKNNTNVSDGDKKFTPGTRETGWRFIRTKSAKKITQLWGDSATFDYSTYSKKFDLIFIDGAHTYEYVLSDSNNAIEILKDNGIILWHDYSASWPGVVQALNELYKKNASFKNIMHIRGTSLVILSSL